MRYKLPVYLLLVLLLSVIPAGVLRAEGQIGQIQIIGETRMNQGVLLSYLPVQVGEEWKESDLELVKKSLLDLNIFHPQFLDVTAEHQENGDILLQIHVVDPQLLMLDLPSYLSGKVVEALYGAVSQTVYNPFGVGVNLVGRYGWGPNSFLNAEVTGPVVKGINYSVNYYNLDQDLKLADERTFQVQGHHLMANFKQYVTVDWRQAVQLEYFASDLTFEGEEAALNYVIVNTKTEFQDKNLNLYGTYLYNLKDDPSSWKLAFDYTYKMQVTPKDKGIISVKAGTASEHTPVNFQFIGGGFTPLPLRGAAPYQVGTNYGLLNLEYQRTIVGNFLAIGFADLGQFWSQEQLSEIKPEKTLGVGLAYDSNMGAVLRLDLAKALVSDSFMWNIGIRHTY